MKKFLMFLCAVMLMCFGMVGVAGAYSIIGYGDFSSSATEIDFEDYAVGTAITTQYTGVTFSSVNGTGNPVIDNNEAGGGQGLNGGPGDSSIYTYINQDAPLVMTFDGGAVAAGGAYYIDLSPFIGRGLFYDVHGNLIETFYLDQTIDFWGLRADVGDNLIGSIVFDSSGGYSGCSFGATTSESYTVDNLIYEVAAAPVPEPSTILLMSVGLLGLVGYNRKRFSKKS